MFYSRDCDAARKICYLFLYRLCHEPEVPLGVWSRSVKVADMEGELERSTFLVEFQATLRRPSTIHPTHPLRAASNHEENELEL